MGSLSVSTHGGLVQWQGLLLLVSLLIFCSPPTTAIINVVPTFASEGGDALLRIQNKPPRVEGIVWYKGSIVYHKNIIAFFMVDPPLNVTGPGYNGQEMITDDGSLLLKNVTMNDAGMYTVVAHLPHAVTETGYGELHVYEPLRNPILLASGYWVIENEDTVVLTCYTNGLSIQWLFNDMNLQFTNRMKLSGNNRRLTINPVKREDAGVYKCNTSNPIMWVESQPLDLHVAY